MTPDTLIRARALGIDARARLDDNDSYSVFAALGDLLVTGPTRTNVDDFRAILIDAPPVEAAPLHTLSGISTIERGRAVAILDQRRRAGIGEADQRRVADKLADDVEQIAGVEADIDRRANRSRPRSPRWPSPNRDC